MRSGGNVNAIHAIQWLRKCVSAMNACARSEHGNVNAIHAPQWLNKCVKAMNACARGDVRTVT